MVGTKLPISSRSSGEELYTSFLEAYNSRDDLDPVVFESEQISLRFCPQSKSVKDETTVSHLAKLVDNSSSCPELRKVAEAARKAASTRDFKPHGFVEHILGMSASLLGMALLACLVVGVLGVCAIVIGVLVPFDLI